LKLFKIGKNSGVYYERLILAVQAELGLIVVLTVFYLGKIHDYRRDYTKSLGNLFQVLYEFRKKFTLRHWSLEKGVFEMAEKAEDKFNDIEHDLHTLITIVISVLIFFVGMIAMIFVLATKYENSLSQNDFIIIGLFAATAFTEFIVIWAMFEMIISAHRKALNNLLYSTAVLKNSLN